VAQGLVARMRYPAYPEKKGEGTLWYTKGYYRRPFVRTDVSVNLVGTEGGREPPESTMGGTKTK